MIPKEFNGFTPKIVNNRNCNNCTLCCKLPEINELGYEKKSFKWCSKCDLTKNNCSIYENRPLTCKTFSCFYLDNKTDLKPSNVGFFIFEEKHITLKHGDKLVRTIYCEKNKLNELIKHLNSDNKIKDLIKKGFAFHIRYDQNDKHIKIYDPNTFGERLVFFHKNWSNEQQQKAINNILIQNYMQRDKEIREQLNDR